MRTSEDALYNIQMASTRGSLDSTLERMDYGRALKEALLTPEKSTTSSPYARPFLDAVMLFEELRIGYALVGGIAAMYYGRARFTEDVEIVAVMGHMVVLMQNASVMERFHFDSSCTFKLYHQSGMQIDFWKDEYADGIVQRGIKIQLAGRAVRMAEPHDLIAMKLRAGRLVDDYDIAQVAAGNLIDLVKLRSLVTEKEFAAFQAIMKRA